MTATKKVPSGGSATASRGDAGGRGRRIAAPDAAVAAIADALVAGALPGETDRFDAVDRTAAAVFIGEVAARRAAGHPALRIESVAGEDARRRMRLAVVNDDMPFLVDSTAAAIAAHGLDIHRLLHPVIPVRRDAEGLLTAVLPAEESGERRESMIYMEIERADAKERRALAEDLRAVLADVRAAVGDWQKMQAALRADSDTLADPEGAALLRWFGDRHFTLLGHRIETPEGRRRGALGILNGTRAA